MIGTAADEITTLEEKEPDIFSIPKISVSGVIGVTVSGADLNRANLIGIASTILQMPIAESGTAGSPYRFPGNLVLGDLGRVFIVGGYIADGNFTTADFSMIENESLLNEGFVPASEPHTVIRSVARDVEPSAYVEIPTGPGRRHEPVIKGKGVPIWVLVAYVEKRDLTPDEVSQLWNGYITTDEVVAALLYKKEHPEAVEDRLEDES